jgi:FKBP-type peptidyl-prolyl cis-trans isomerase
MYLRLFAVMIMLTYLAGCAPEEASSASELKLDTSKNRISYTIGVNIGQDFKSQNMDVDPDLLLMGLKDTLSGKELQLTEEEMVQEIQNFQQEMQVKMAAEMEAKAAENKAAGEAYLAENAKQEGVVVTESGLQYKIIEPGQGDSPGPADVATVHYRGTLIDGTQFDSSYDRNEPAVFGVGGVIAGFSEALQLMPVGSHYRFVVPGDLAYGPGGSGQTIGPNATLIFEIELLEIVE